MLIEGKKYIYSFFFLLKFASYFLFFPFLTIMVFLKTYLMLSRQNISNFSFFSYFLIFDFFSSFRLLPTHYVVTFSMSKKASSMKDEFK